MKEIGYATHIDHGRFILLTKEGPEIVHVEGLIHPERGYPAVGKMVKILSPGFQIELGLRMEIAEPLERVPQGGREQMKILKTTLEKNQGLKEFLWGNGMKQKVMIFPGKILGLGIYSMDSLFLEKGLRKIQHMIGLGLAQVTGNGSAGRGGDPDTSVRERVKILQRIFLLEGNEAPGLRGTLRVDIDLTGKRKISLGGYFLQHGKVPPPAQGRID